MNCIQQSGADVDVPTPTKDEPVVSETCNFHAMLGENTNDADETPELPTGSMTGSESRDCTTPTVDEKYSALDCPTPTLDEPVEQYTTTSDRSDLSISDVKCKLFVKDDCEVQSESLLSKVEEKDVKGSGTSQETVADGESSSQGQHLKPVDEESKDKEPKKDGSGGQGLETKMGEKDTKIPNLTKTLSNESTLSHDSNEDQKQITITHSGDEFTCTECDFTGKGHHFEEHLMCHLILKPYQCLYCKEAFASRKEVGKHLSTMHKGKKLNCMLKALSRAKNLMLQAKKNNSCVFYALISGSELSLKRKQSVESIGSVGTLSRTSSASDSSEPTLPKLPGRQTSCASENDSLKPERFESSSSKDKTMPVEDLKDVMDGFKETQEDPGSRNSPKGDKSEELEENSQDDSKDAPENDKIEHETLEEVSDNRKELEVNKDHGSGCTDISLKSGNVSENEAKDDSMTKVVTKDKAHAPDSELSEMSEVPANITPDCPGKETTNLGSYKEENKEVLEDDSMRHALINNVSQVPDTNLSDDTMKPESFVRDDSCRISKAEDTQRKSDSDVPEYVDKDEVLDTLEVKRIVNKDLGEVVSGSSEDNDKKEVTDKREENVVNEASEAAEDDDMKEASFQREEKDVTAMLDVEDNDKREMLADSEDSDKKGVSIGYKIHSTGKEVSENGMDSHKDVSGDGKDNSIDLEVSGDFENNIQKEVSGDGEGDSIERVLLGDDHPLSVVKDIAGQDITGGESKDIEMEIPGNDFPKSAAKDNDTHTESGIDAQEDNHKDVDSETHEGRTNLEYEESRAGISDHVEGDGRHAQEHSSCHDDVASENTVTDEVCRKDHDQVQHSESSNSNSGEKVDDTSSNDLGDMGLKIVASFSLDGDAFSKPEEGKDGDNSELTTPEAQSAETTDKSADDTSGLVIDVFKDGRISVHNTKETISSEEADKTVFKTSEQTAEVNVESVAQSKPQQSKLGQLLSGTAAFPTSVAISSSPPAASTQPASKTTEPKPPPVPGITPAQMKHMRNPNFYVCGLNCNFSCLNSVEFRDHLFMGHAGEKTFPCYYCGWLAHTEESLLRHITNHAHNYSKIAPLYLCGMQRCKFGTNLLSDLLNHMQILHHDITLYICKECYETFSDVKELVSHFDENFIHVVNCPHCACKGTDRRMILKHISEYHPGKAKMVSVAKQIICKDRKVNNYKQIKAQYKRDSALVSETTSIPGAASSAVSEKKQVPTTSSSATYTTLRHNETTSQSDATKVKVENTVCDNDYGKISSSAHAAATKTHADGSPPEKQIKAPKCSHCTFVARDQKRLESHMKCHGLPVIKRHRFRCLYCPQGFDSSQKFRLHINCHPGLIKYWMYCCKRCDFDTNQRYVMLRHIRTRDELHFNEGNEEDMFSVVERIVESRVLECEHCNYQTRHKLHLQIHYQREHKVVKAAAQSSTDADKHSLAQQVAWVSPPKRSSSSSDTCQENMSKKFKCPFCRYLVPKAADLKSHVKKHANLGKITLDFLRCRYCSLSSTAREIVYTHIRDKHKGKPMVLVRKIVTIDCSGTDNSFSETSVTEAPVAVTSSSGHGIDKFQCETCSFATNNRGQFEAHVQLHNTTKGGILGMSMDADSDDDVDEEDMETGVDHPQPEDDDTSIRPAPEVTPSPVDVIEQVYVIPEAVAGDQLSSPARCCNCYYASGYRSAFIDHMKTNHPSVMLVIRNKGTAVEQICPSGKMFFGLPSTLNNEVLLVPDRQVFTQAVKCPKCPYFTTYFRRNLVLHLTKDHPEITAMGKCTWPGWQTDSGDAAHAVSMKQEHATMKKQKRPISPQERDESCIIGSGDLDEQIACLYKNFGDRQQCLICNSVKPKKFFMHIHLLRHLNIFLVKCPYCSHQGLQKYKIGRHIRTNHPEHQNFVEEVQNDIPKKVAEFLAHQKKVVAAATTSPPPSGDNVTFMDNKHLSVHSGSPGKDIHGANKMSGPLGTSYLDEKLLCLYTCSEGKNKCNLCSVEFSRKYAIHRHIVVNHLKVSLLKCGHCNFEGVEKHVIIDHILEQHKNQPIKFEPLNINMEGKVQEFLNTYNVVKSEPGSVDVKPLFSPSPVKSFGPQAYCLGKDKLHNKLMPLFSRKNDSYKCNLCKWKFPRKYAIHRHILMKHLKIGLYGCTHCHVQGAEKYIVVSHMKEAHPKVAPQARILEVDMDHRIKEVLHEVASGTGSHTSGRKPPTYYDEDIPDPVMTPTKSMTEYQDDEEDKKPTEADKKQMVVAMFGKKRKSLEPAEPSQLESAITPKKLKTTSRMVDVTTEIKVVCIEEGSFKKYVCEKCRFTSLHRSNVYRHVLRIHERYRELQCEYCGYKSYSKVLLNQHIEVEHGGKALLKDTKYTPTSVKEEPKEPKPDPHSSSSPGQTVKHYACAYCNFETNTAENIIKHTRENHAPGSGETVNSAAAGDKSTASSDPDVTVSTHEHVIKKSSVKRGTFTESQMLYCGYCTFKAPGIQALKDHHKAMHHSSKLCIISPQPWRYICRICGLKNNAGSKMRCHLNRHLEYRPYTCSSCSQPYASTDELRKHVRSLQHSDNFQYRKHEKKEQKINRFLEESRKNALLVNLGAPPDSDSVAVPTKQISSEKLKEGKPSTEFKFKGIKRSMKMPMSPTKSLKKKYMKAGLDRDSKAVTKDIACYWCDIPHTVCVDQMRQHHAKAHQDKDFLWVDTRQGNTCTIDGEIVECGNLAEIPKIYDLYASKKLNTGKTKFYCTKCSFSAWYLPAMVSHCRCHLPKKYLCAYCHLRYSNKEYLEKHQRTFHPGQEIWMLHMLEKNAGHRPPQATSTQPSVASTISVKQELLDETATAAAVDERRISQSVTYCCNFCSYRNESLYQYRLHLPMHGTFKHLKTDLLNDSPLKCGFCPFVAADQSDFSFHITTHFENRSFKCAHCDYSAYTRAHVKFHSANQHPDMEQTVLDLSSCSSYVEYLKAEKTNLPKLVDLDPQVVVKDITTMTQHDLEEMMTREHKSVCYEDVDVDVVGIEVVMDKMASERKVDRNVVNVVAEAGGHPADYTEHHPEDHPADHPADQSSPAIPVEDEKAITSVSDDCDPQAVVSSSIGELEETPDFDLAEVSAFVEDAVIPNVEMREDKDSKEGHEVLEADSKQSSGNGSVQDNSKYLDSSFDDQVNGSASADEIDGEFPESDCQNEVVPKVKEPEERQRKDDSGNVFDTLHSWLSMK